jgi:hypothetical protein
MRWKKLGLRVTLALVVFSWTSPIPWIYFNSARAQDAPLPSTLIDRPVPLNMIPTIALAKSDRPKPYSDRCHTQQNLSKSLSTCEYGNLKSKTSIVLFGDSHALSWFPAIEKLAIAKGWKLISLTMSSCWPADIPAWNSTTHELMPNCTIWRDATINDLLKIKPKAIFISGTRGFSTIDENNQVLSGDSRTAAWESGMRSTLMQLKTATQNLVYISDTPMSIFDVPECLRLHPKSIAACATPFSKSVSLDWLAEEEKVANLENAIWVNPTSWICTTDPCSPLVGRYEIFVDKGHLTASFAATLEKPLWAKISPTLH